VRRVFLAVTGTVAVLVMLLGFKTSAPSVTSRPAVNGPPVPAGSSQGGTTRSGTGSTSSGTISGQAVDTRYGPVQVQVTFAGGRITDVQELQLPDQDPRSSEISSYAGPALAQEAMQAQSAQIDVISGATYTSDGYAQSLQSAIDQARG
jgi:uncharacterized protein with FMN-binding domain